MSPLPFFWFAHTAKETAASVSVYLNSKSFTLEFSWAVPTVVTLDSVPGSPLPPDSKGGKTSLL